MNGKVKGLAKETLFDIVGGLLIAVGIYNFAIGADFPLTGVSGICLILYRLTGLPIGLGPVLVKYTHRCMLLPPAGAGLLLPLGKKHADILLHNRRQRAHASGISGRPPAGRLALPHLDALE